MLRAAAPHVAVPLALLTVGACRGVLGGLGPLPDATDDGDASTNADSAGNTSDSSGDAEDSPPPACRALQGTPKVCPVPKYTLGSNQSTAGHGAYAVAVGDMNCDGFEDIVTGNPTEGAPTVGVLLGNGDGGFAPMVQYPASPLGTASPIASPGAIALGDLDGNGYLDVVAMGGDYGAFPFMLLNNGGKLDAPVTIMLGASDPAANTLAYGANVVAADMGGKGNIDVVIEPSGGSGYVAILLNDGRPSFKGQNEYMLASAGLAGLAVADYDGDGKMDVAALACDGHLVVALNTGGGALGVPTTVQWLQYQGCVGNLLAAADFDDDGIVDLAASDGTTNVGVFLNDRKSPGTFMAPMVLVAPNNSGVNLLAADLNGDGKLDLALSQGSDDTVVAFLNQGGASFAQAHSLVVGQQVDRIAAGDFTASGILGLTMSSYDLSAQTPGATLFIASGGCAP